MKVIITEVKDCCACPFHKEQLATWPYGNKPSSIPICCKAGRELPYTIEGEAIKFVKTDWVIPDWCPLDSSPRDTVLEDAAKICESLFDLTDDSCNEAERCAQAIRDAKEKT